MGRLCAANKKCVSVCQSARASGPICAPPSLPLPPSLRAAPRTPPGHLQPRRVSAAAAAALSLSPHRGGTCTDTTDRTGSASPSPSPPSPPPHPLCLFPGLFPLLSPPGCSRGLVRGSCVDYCSCSSTEGRFAGAELCVVRIVVEEDGGPGSGSVLRGTCSRTSCGRRHRKKRQKTQMCGGQNPQFSR